MTSINRSALVNFSAKQMYDLVNDIENYPQFMRGCEAARIVSQSENELTGELTLGKGGFRQSFTTRNKLTPDQMIEMQLVEGAFSDFKACWQFKILTGEACKISLEMEFEFDSGVMNFVLEKLFNSSANNLVDAVVKRAQSIYG
jgi:ribosome-associated toxin RatA of RatAB toxin-antitoxin module